MGLCKAYQENGQDLKIGIGGNRVGLEGDIEDEIKNYPLICVYF